jgi:DNA-binding transcriptional regulator LsrR (DeoR family)
MDIIDLDKTAIEIARKHLLQGISYREIGNIYHASPSTIYRRLTKWLNENRFELRDKVKDGDGPTKIEVDDDLGEALVRKTGLWRARVVRISRLETASYEKERKTPEKEDIQAAFKSSDELHRCLGEVAGELLLQNLRKNITIGVSSGRGVGFTVEKLRELIKRTPSWGEGFDNIHLVSLCGGSHVGMWEYTNSRDFDADENVFALSTLLKVPRKNISYTTGPVAVNRKNQPSAYRNSLNPDLVITGLGELNNQHPYFRDRNELQLKGMTDPMRRLVEWQAMNPELLYCIAEIVLRLYPIGEKGISVEFKDTIEEINDTILAVAPEKIRNAGDIILIAGGIQKLKALSGVLLGKNPGIPIEKTNLTLVTDAWTAEQVLRQTPQNHIQGR